MLHQGKPFTKDEVLTPTIQNILVVIWLNTINPALPQLFQRNYATDLRHKTLAPLKPEISIAMPSLVEEIQAVEEGKTF